MRRIGLGKVGYGQLAGAAATSWVMAYFYSHGHNIFSGWYLLWPLFAGTITIASAVQAFRKWRLSDGHSEFVLPTE